MGKVAVLDKHGPYKGPPEGWDFGDPPQLLKGEVHVLKR